MLFVNLHICVSGVALELPSALNVHTSEATASNQPYQGTPSNRVDVCPSTFSSSSLNLSGGTVSSFLNSTEPKFLFQNSYCVLLFFL